jgi:nucleoside-diphosphate kinase
MKRLVTLALFKPDLIKRFRNSKQIDSDVTVNSTPLPQRGYLQYLPTIEKQEIKEKIEASGLRILARKYIHAWSRREAEAFYASHRGRFYYPRLVHYMTTGPLEALLLTHEDPKVDPTPIWRTLIGPTHITIARTLPHTLRGRYALSDTKNSFHGSDSLETAFEELRFFFSDLSLSESFPSSSSSSSIK